jgi:tetratricopeptide (TPR) repeat protein
VIALLLWRDVEFLPHPLYRWTQGDFYPSGAVRYLAALPDSPQRLFNLYNWGGYLMLHAPAVKVFIDGRANTLYDERVYDDYLRAYAGGPGAREVLRKYGVDAVLAPPGAGVVRVVLSEPEPWRVAYADPTALLLLAPWRWGSGRELPPVEDVLAGTPDLALMRGAAARLRGEGAIARSELEKAVRLNPLLLAAYAELMAIAAEERDRGAVERWRDAALDAYPRQASRIHSHAAASLEALGDLDGALEALRLSMPRGPFQTTRYVEARILRLEARRRLARGGGE